MFFFTEKETKLLTKKKISIKDIENSDNIVLRLTNNVEENKEFSIYYEIKNIMENIPYSLILYSKDNKKLVQNYKDNHNNIANIENEKFVQRINNINIETLMDTFKKTYVLNIIVNKNETDKINELKKISFIEEDIKETVNNILPINYKELKNDEVIEVTTQKNKKKYLKQIKPKNNEEFEISPADLIMKTKNKTSKLYIKMSYKNHNREITFWIRNISKENLLKDYENIRKNLIKENYLLDDKNSLKDLYYSLPMYSKKELKGNHNGYNGFPSYIIEKNNHNANLLFKDNNERIIPFNIFEEENKNFILSGETGRGQTTLFKNIIFNYLLDNTKIRVITRGGQYDRLADMVGGEKHILTDIYSSFKLFNSKELSKEEIKNTTDLILALIDEPSSYAELKKHIEEAIKNTYAIFEEETNLKLIYELLIKNKKIQSKIKKLSPFATEKGEYFHIFNGKEDLDLDNDYITFDLSRMENGNIYEAMIIFLNNRIQNELKNTVKKSMLIIDDPYNMNKPILKEYLRRNIYGRNNYAFGINTYTIGEFNNIGINFIFKPLITDEYFSENERSKFFNLEIGTFNLKSSKINSFYKLELNNTMKIILEENEKEIYDIIKESKIKDMNDIELQIKKALQAAEG